MVVPGLSGVGPNRSGARIANRRCIRGPKQASGSTSAAPRTDRAHRRRVLVPSGPNFEFFGVGLLRPTRTTGAHQNSTFSETIRRKSLQRHHFSGAGQSTLLLAVDKKPIRHLKICRGRLQQCRKECSSHTSRTTGQGLTSARQGINHRRMRQK